MSEGTMRIPSLINRAAVKRHLLEVAHANGRTRFTRVSKGTLDEAEASLRAWISGRVHRAPSLGKTL